MCFHGLIVHFFLALNNISLYSYTTICLSVHLQKDILSCFQYGATTLGFPAGSDSKQSACNAGDQSLIPGSGRSLEKGMATQLQYSCLEKPTDREPWPATVHGVPELGTTFTFTDKATVNNCVQVLCGQGSNPSLLIADGFFTL